MAIRRITRGVRIGEGLMIGGDAPIVVQTMCTTHTRDVDASVDQCRRLARAGAQLIRLTVPTLEDVQALAEIRRRLRAEGILTPLVADVHFSADIALAAAAVVEKVRINPGNFHRDPAVAHEKLAALIDICRAHGTVLRIGLNHGSLGERITARYGNTPEGMKEAAMEWLRMCRELDFDQVVVSLKASNTLVMIQAYRLLDRAMAEEGFDNPLHLGVTEAGNGDAGRIKSCIGIATLLREGIGDTVRVSLTEDPERELAPACYLAGRYSDASHSDAAAPLPVFAAKTTASGLSGGQDAGLLSSADAASRNRQFLSPLHSSLVSLTRTGRALKDGGAGCMATAVYAAPSRERLLLDAACDLGPALIDRDVDEIHLEGTWRDENGRLQSLTDSPLAEHLSDEILQAARRRFYRPEYVACPGCGRTMYKLEQTFDEVKRRTAHLKGLVIAVMGCIVNGPGEMADADWGYVGEGGGKVSIYRGKTPLLRHVPEAEAIDRLLELIERERE